MIAFQNVSKSYRLRDGSLKPLISNLSIDLPWQNLAVLGRNGVGKSTLLRMISGIEGPSNGRILRRGSISWPIGFRGSFHRELTGQENVRFVARLYGQNTEYVIDYVQEFAELGQFFDEPVKSYSSGMVARLAFGVSMAISFDTYLVDELLSVGDASFKDKCRHAFKEKLGEAKVIMVSHSMPTLRDFCSAGVILHEGSLTYYDHLPDAIEFYRKINNMATLSNS